MPLQLRIKMPGMQVGLAVKHSNNVSCMHCVVLLHWFADRHSMTKRYNMFQLNVSCC